MEQMPADNTSNNNLVTKWPNGNATTNGTTNGRLNGVVKNGETQTSIVSESVEDVSALLPEQLETSGSGDNGTLSNGCSSTAGISRNCASKSSVTDVNAATGSDEDSDDDYCVYTYKGGSSANQPLADLPSSFYQFDSSDNQSDELSSHPGEIGSASTGSYRNHMRFSDDGRRLKNSNGVSGSSAPRANAAPDMFSPDMDFLEMDFDPSVYADPDGNDYSSPDDDCVNVVDIVEKHEVMRADMGDGNPVLQKKDPPAESQSPKASCSRPGDSSQSYSVSAANSRGLETVSQRGISELKSINDERKSSNVPSCDCACVPETDRRVASSNVLNITSSENQVSLRLVKSNTLPLLASKPGNALTSDTFNFRPSERSSVLFSSGPVFRDSDMVYKARIKASEETNNEDTVDIEVGRVMIWDLAEAKEIAVNQIGTSACGATALLNVLRALKMDASPEFVNACVGTRLRAETADLSQYLFSRSDAGATHDDLISGIRRASKDLIYARFFPIKRSISVPSFNKWILHWICKGAVPVVTRNLQIGSFSSPQEIPDSWHHQMVFGVSPEGLFLNNPFECVPVSALLPEITSDSVILIRRQDIINHKGPHTDLRQLARHEDPRWNEMNVLGQVANILLEEIPYFSENTAARRVRSSHIRIPAKYKAGVTLCILRDSPSFSQLQSASDPY